LRQDYPNKELIILNDCLGQELICDEPGVRVVNVAERFPSIGDKQNAAVGPARGELIAPWDDDISLPWRLSLSVERLGDGDYFNPRCYWYLDNDGLHFDHSIGYANNGSLFRRAAFEGRRPLHIDRQVEVRVLHGDRDAHLCGGVNHDLRLQFGDGLNDAGVRDVDLHQLCSVGQVFSVAAGQVVQDHRFLPGDI
jgi:hypothetical protein